VRPDLGLSCIIIEDASSVPLSVLSIFLAGSIFGILHTTLAALRVKDWARQRWGKRRVDSWYRLFYSSLAGATFLPVLLLIEIVPDRVLYTISAPWLWLTTGLQLAALIFFFRALLQTDVMRFIGLRQLLRGGKPVPVDQHERLVTSGPYRWVRHPLYFATILILLLWPKMTANWAALIAVTTAYFYLGSIPEEQKLVEEFGEAYRRYQRMVPRLIPRPGRAYQAET
jgi:protein-S-isoprenylcysteine O-methyltransferase Ste14